MVPRSILLTVLALFWPLPALAWGPQGHEIVAHIAARELTPRARAQVTLLLGGDSEAMMVTLANWADEIRDARPATTRWHYVNIPLAAPGFDRRRDCPRDDCVAAQIEADRRILADKGRSRAARAEALRFLIHLVGDIHQPLHTIDNNDRGGNDIRVRLGRSRAPISLHQIWDARVVSALQGGDTGALAWRIAASFPQGVKNAWRAGAAADWANESFRFARREIYPPLGDYRPGGRPIPLPGDYPAREAQPARAGLAKAGVRLAWLINTALE